MQDTDIETEFSVCEDACKFTSDKSKATIVIRSSVSQDAIAIENLKGPEPRKLAMGYASSKGIDSARVNGNLIGPYPVNAAGENVYGLTDEEGKQLPTGHERTVVNHYRVGIPITKKHI